MKLKCLHGFFIFEETKVGQVSDFMSLTGLTLVPWRNAFTFEDIVDAPDYSIVGQDLLGAPATVTYEGEPWEVFEENGLVYNFNTGLMVPIVSVTQTTTLYTSGNRFVSPGLILPGSRVQNTGQIRDYSAFYSRDTQRWLYSEVTYV